MAFVKIYYDDIASITDKERKKTEAWQKQISAVAEKLSKFVDTYKFQGKAAEGAKNYINEVLVPLSTVLNAACTSLQVNAVAYYGGYQSEVDQADGSGKAKGGDGGLHYTTIVYDEVNPSGSVKRRINDVQDRVRDVESRANSARQSVAHLMRMSSPNTANLIDQLNEALKKATGVCDRAANYEAKHSGDLNDFNALLRDARSIINAQLGAGRVTAMSYVSGQVGKMVDFSAMADHINATYDNIEKITESPEFAGYYELVASYDSYIEAEERQKREWVKWVAAGIAIVGSVALIVITAGTGSILVGAVAGGVIGGITAGTSSLANEYYKDGDISKDDWKKIGKDAFVGTVVGAVEGGFMVAGPVSGLNTPMEKLVAAGTRGAVKEFAGGMAETAWDVGEAWISGRPGDEIKSILIQDLEKTGVDTALGFVKSGISAGIEGKMNIGVNSDEFLKKFGHETVTNAITSFTDTGLDYIKEWGECVVTGKDFDKIDSLDELGDFGKEVLGQFAKREISSGLDSISGSIKNDHKDYFKDHKGMDRLRKTTVSVIDAAAGNIAEDYINNDFKLDLDSDLALKISKDAVGDIAKDVTKDAVRDRQDKIRAQQDQERLRKEALENWQKAHPGETPQGNEAEMIDVVRVKASDGKTYTFTKSEYDKARALANKDDYEGQTTAEILGMPKGTKIVKDASEGRVHYTRLTEADYDGTENTDATRYKVVNTKSDQQRLKEKAREEWAQTHEGKPSGKEAEMVDVVAVKGSDGNTYYFEKDVYNEARASANKGEYKGKTTADILGMPKGTRVVKDAEERQVHYTRLQEADYDTAEPTDVKRYKAVNNVSGKDQASENASVRTYKDNGITFTVDEKTGTTTAKGIVTKNPASREGMSSIHPDEYDSSTDNKGHLWGAQSGGPAKEYNVFSQDEDLNKHEYVRVENAEIRASQKGIVESEKTAYISHKGSKPDAYMVNDKITNPDGTTKEIHYSFQNASREEQQQWDDAVSKYSDYDQYPNPDPARESMSADEYNSLIDESQKYDVSIREEYET